MVKPSYLPGYNVQYNDFKIIAYSFQDAMNYEDFDRGVDDKIFT